MLQRGTSVRPRRPRRSAAGIAEPRPASPGGRRPRMDTITGHGPILAPAADRNSFRATGSSRSIQFNGSKALDLPRSAVNWFSLKLFAATASRCFVDGPDVPISLYSPSSSWLAKKICGTPAARPIFISPMIADAACWTKCNHAFAPAFKPIGKLW